MAAGTGNGGTRGPVGTVLHRRLGDGPEGRGTTYESAFYYV